MSSSRSKPDATEQKGASSKPANQGRSSEVSKPGASPIDQRKHDPSSRYYVPKDPNYNVYLCYFNTNIAHLDFEVGLLIATDERIIRKGHYYQVKGPGPSRRYKDRLEYHLYYSIFKSPENLMNFRKLAHVGRMKESQLHLALRIAEYIPPPQVVLTFTGESPNCIDWMNNFLFELHRFKVVDFDPDFTTPEKKRVLVHPSLMSPDELIAVGMSPTLSNKFDQSEYDPRSKRHHNNSRSKNGQGQASSNQESSSSKKETSSSKPNTSSSKKPESSPRNGPSSAKASGSSSKQGQPSSQRDKSATASKSGKIPSSKQGKDDSKHKHLSIRRFFSKK